jgi:tetraacyldisaccharide 4'-kinase
MRAPEFWAAPGRASLPARALAPLGCAYALLAAGRQATITAVRATLPVVCVGNLVAGGAGKTPTALAIAELAAELGFHPHFLTRGYGGRVRGPLRVEPARHTAALVGDEALLLAARAPTWVATDRPRGAAKAAAAGADLLVMDDGLQNPSLIKDLALLVVDGGFGFGNGQILPAGPLREPLARGLKRAHAIVLIGADQVGVRAGLPATAPPVLEALLVPGPEAFLLRERGLIAFAGIGRPAKFFETLEALGCTLIERHAFADHHRYAEEELMRLCEAASRHGGKPVTTAKDAARLPPEARAMVDVLTVTLEWRDPAQVRALLGAHLKSARVGK